MIKPLTSLRFFFAMMVFFHHADFLSLRGSDAPSTWVYQAIFKEGFMGVSFFYILSGLVLSHTYDAVLTQQVTFNTLKTFWKKRIARIYPLHLFGLLVALPFTYPFFEQNKLLWAGTLGLNFFLLHSFVPVREVFFSFNKVSWSLSNEIFFYLLFPLIYKIAQNKRLTRLLLQSLVMISFLLALLWAIPSPRQHYIFYIHPGVRLLDFYLGIWLYWVIKRTQHLYPLSRSFASAWEGLTILIFVVFFSFHQHVSVSYRYGLYYWFPICLLLVAFYHQKGYISQLLSRKPFVILGEISFSVYMLHQPIMRYTLYCYRHFMENDSVLLVLCTSFCLTVGASYFTFRFIEKPFIEKINPITNL